MALSALTLVLLRGAHLAALAALFGTLVSLMLVAPAALREAGGGAAAMAQRALLHLAARSAALALLTCVAWTALEATAIAGAASVAGAAAALGTVLGDTRFGHLALVRLALLGIAAILVWRLAARGPAGAGGASSSPPPLRAMTAGTALLAGAALAMQGGFGHAGAAGGGTGVTLLASEALHLLAAGAWLGGLMPLFLLVRILPPAAAATACQSFSPVGLAAVLAIACTAVVQAWELVGGIGGLFGTRYGAIALLKLGLFLLLLLLAGINRFALTERLRHRAGTGLMQASIALEAALGLLVILAASWLASSTPATHEAPLWPFSRRPTLDLLADPAIQALALRILAPTLMAAALVVLGRLWRPLFWPALAGLAVCLAVAIPNLVPLLTAEAYPTTFVASPTEFAASSIVRGAVLFRANCIACHGADARGRGPAAASLPVPPADLTAPHLWAHTEGDLFWFVTHGIAFDGKPTMPAFGEVLSSGQRWALIDFLRANNAGASMRANGRWEQPVALPQFDAVCADGAAIDLDDVRGRPVHIIAVAGPVTPPAALPGVATILLARDRAVKPAGSACVATEPAAWDAFALLLGVTPDTLVGMQVLADQNGWLRLRWRPGDAGDWNDPASFAAAVRDIASHPLATGAAGGHAHHH